MRDRFVSDLMIDPRNEANSTDSRSYAELLTKNGAGSDLANPSIARRSSSRIVESRTLLGSTETPGPAPHSSTRASATAVHRVCNVISPHLFPPKANRRSARPVARAGQSPSPVRQLPTCSHRCPTEGPTHSILHSEWKDSNIINHLSLSTRDRNYEHAYLAACGILWIDRPPNRRRVHGMLWGLDGNAGPGRLAP